MYYYRVLVWQIGGYLGNSYDNFRTNDIYLLCGAYDRFFEGGEWSVENIYPTRYFIIDNVKIFLSSRTDAIFNQTPLKESYNVSRSYDEPIDLSSITYLVFDHRTHQVTFSKGDDIETNSQPILQWSKKFVPPTK